MTCTFRVPHLRHLLPTQLLGANSEACCHTKGPMIIRLVGEIQHHSLWNMASKPSVADGIYDCECLQTDCLPYELRDYTYYLFSRLEPRFPRTGQSSITPTVHEPFTSNASLLAHRPAMSSA